MIRVTEHSVQSEYASPVDGTTASTTETLNIPQLKLYGTLFQAEP